MSTDDEERLTPLEAAVNGQDRSSFASSPRRPSRNSQDVICAQAPSRPAGRAYARAERSDEPCTVPSTDRASIA